jgi:hypothetical protein
MRTDPHPNEVRGIVERVFARYLTPRPPRHETVAASGHGQRNGGFVRIFQPREEEPDFDDLEIDETILIDQGRYVARSYRIAGYLAMWMVPVGILQFYDERGRMLTTINLFESLRPQRMAA